jgi:hypothetical protein
MFIFFPLLSLRSGCQFFDRTVTDFTLYCYLYKSNVFEILGKHTYVWDVLPCNRKQSEIKWSENVTLNWLWRRRLPRSLLSPRSWSPLVCMCTGAGHLMIMMVLQKDTSRNHTHLPKSLMKVEHEIPYLKIEIITDKNMNNDHRIMIVKSLYFLWRI